MGFRVFFFDLRLFFFLERRLEPFLVTASDDSLDSLSSDDKSDDSDGSDELGSEELGSRESLSLDEGEDHAFLPLPLALRFLGLSMPMARPT